MDRWMDTAQPLQSCATICDAIDCAQPGSSVRGIFQAGMLEWVAISFSRRSPRLKDRTLSPVSSALAGESFTVVPPGVDTCTGR